MMFILRGKDAAPPAVAVKVSRRTPATVPDGAGKTDWFCLGDEAAMAALRAAGLEIVVLRDGWYADDAGGGVAIWGQGRYWEIRDTPFTVKEAAGPASSTAAGEAGAEPVNVRGAVFGV
jgi:hypothetical protein